MSNLRQLRAARIFALLAVMVLVLSACAAPAAPAAPADTGAAGEASAGAAGDLPAEPGRGTDGEITMLYWQAPTILNPYLSTGTKDFHAASLILEPLLWIDPEGTFIPALAAEVPTLENGGVSEDQTTVTYKLREGVLWSDGTPFTAADVVFTWQYCTTEGMPCTSTSSYEGVANVEAVDDTTVTITFDGPKPYPYGPFVSQLGLIVQAAQFADCLGPVAQECSEQNLAPIGTGPYKVESFAPGDTVVYSVNENFREASMPHFAGITIKGGGDAAAAARAALETGEVDYAWNLQVEPAVLNPMAEAGMGTVVSSRGGLVERILINFTNPDPALGENRSNWLPDGSTAHPFLSDLNVRMALSMAIDRTILAEQLYGFAGDPTCNILSGPPAVVSTANDACLTQDIEGAIALLEESGYVDSNGDGVREKDGVELRVLYLTSTNAVRQKAQALIQQWWQEIGVATELKNVDAGVYFGGDPASPDTLNKFYADVQMFANNPESLDPQTYLAGWLCRDGAEIARAENQFNGQNYERWCSAEYDAMWDEFAATSDPAARAEMAKALNDMLAQEVVNIPLIFRGDVSAHANDIAGVAMNSWDSQLWNIGEWSRVR
jgi:peptide/nickel transport system substrate-binding protein